MEAKATRAEGQDRMDTTAARTHKSPHRALITVLLVLAVITGFVGMFSVWVNRQALNTENWTNTSSELLANKDIQQAVGTYMVDQLFQNVNVQGQIQSLLPQQAQAVAGPATAGLRQLGEQVAPKVLARPRVQEAWRTANQAAHKTFMKIVNGGGNIVSTQNGEVVLNLRTLVTDLATNLGVEQQVAAARQKLQGSAGQQARNAAQQKLGVTLPPSTGQLVIMKSNDLSTVQDVAHGIRRLAVIFTIIPFALFAAAIWLAHGWRRVALRTTGWCFTGLGLTVLFARRALGDRVVDNLVASNSVKPAAHAAWTIGTSLLYDIAIAMLAFGILLVVSAWLAGATRPAVGLRRALAPSMRERVATVWSVVALAYLLILLWGPIYATRKPIGIVLFAVLIVLGVEVLRRQIVREFPDAQPGDTTARIRAWWQHMRTRREEREAAPARSVAQRFDDLERLEALHNRGVLTDAEYEAEKGQLLHAG